MDRGAWRATVYGIAKVGHDLTTKPPKVVGIQNGTTSLENSFTSFEAKKKTNQKNLKIHDPAIPLLGLYAREMKP